MSETADTDQPKNLVLGTEEGQPLFYGQCELVQVGGANGPCRPIDCSRAPEEDGDGRGACRAQVEKLLRDGTLVYAEGGCVSQKT